VTPASGGAITPQDVLAHCRRRLPASKAPEEIIFLRNLPHNGSGKVLKSKLKEMIAHRDFPSFTKQDLPSDKHPQTKGESCLI
jgi:acyl-CoA synthetase (AMP-forming)/AMP-acid ligase II